MSYIDNVIVHECLSVMFLELIVKYALLIEQKAIRLHNTPVKIAQGLAFLPE